MKFSVSQIHNRPQARYTTIADLAPGQIGVLASREDRDPEKIPWYSIKLSDCVTLYVNQDFEGTTDVFAEMGTRDRSRVRILEPGESFTITVTA